MKHYYNTFLFTMLFLFVGNVTAQQDSELKKTINTIKKNRAEYLYSEITMPDKRDALSNAMESLQELADLWIEKEGGNKAVARNMEQVAEKIELLRGNMFRAFVYVRKKDIMANDGNSGVDTETMSSVASGNITPSKDFEKLSLHKAIDCMLPIIEYEAMVNCIKKLKSEGSIEKYARYTEDVEELENYVLVIYNSDGIIEAILSPGVNRINYKTGLPDSLDSYRGSGIKRGALIVKLKQ